MVHPGGYGFVAYDANVLAAWNPTSPAAPRASLVQGSVLASGSADETEGLRFLVPAPMGAQASRWDLLQGRATNGWIKLVVFIDVFKLKGGGEMKHAVARAGKEIKAKGFQVDDESAAGVGRPPKQARLRDLKRVYPNFR